MNQILHCDWLLEQARWSYLAHLGQPALSCKNNFPENHIMNPLSLYFSLYLPHPFLEVIDLDSLSVHKHTKKELGQYPAILTSHFVNNPYMLSISRPILLSNYICSSRKYVYHPLPTQGIKTFWSEGFCK